MYTYYSIGSSQGRGREGGSIITGYRLPKQSIAGGVRNLSSLVENRFILGADSFWEQYRIWKNIDRNRVGSWLEISKCKRAKARSLRARDVKESLSIERVAYVMLGGMN